MAWVLVGLAGLTAVVVAIILYIGWQFGDEDDDWRNPK